MKNYLAANSSKLRASEYTGLINGHQQDIKKNRRSLAYINFSTNHNGYRALLRTRPSAKHDGISKSCIALPFSMRPPHYSKLLAYWNKKRVCNATTDIDRAP